MKDRLLNALKSADADYCDIRFETRDATAIGQRGNEIDNVSSSKTEGGVIRACVKGGWGTVAYDSLTDIDKRIAQACDAARRVGVEKTELAENGAPREAVVRVALKNDFRGVPLDDKINLVKNYNNKLLTSGAAIETTRVHYSDLFRTIHFASSRGNYFMEERPRVVLYLVAVARNGSNVQNAMKSFSSARDYNVVLGREDVCATVAKRASDLVSAPKCPGGKFTVLLDNELAGVFVHEAFGHLSEADFLYENPKMKELMALGRPMGVPQLQIIDDGSMPDRIGSYAYDEEGTPSHKTYLIRDGQLAGHLHSLETAAKMKAQPTGNARTVGRSHSPIVRMSNTYIDNGNASFDQLISGIDDGIYAKGMLGGQTMMEMFTFSAAYGYRIKKGKVCELLRDITLTGNVFETLNAIDGIGNDLVINETGGGCGKGGQAPLPVTDSSPHLRIRDVVVGGAAAQ